MFLSLILSLACMDRLILPGGRTEDPADLMKWPLHSGNQALAKREEKMLHAFVHPLLPASALGRTRHIKSERGIGGEVPPTLYV